MKVFCILSDERALPLAVSGHVLGRAEAPGDQRRVRPLRGPALGPGPVR
ncbi:MAG: hypothetical protein MZU91_08100 [Desulfosudis oleivorans]|nr:hypothetical protein [Desulfosudis oleivorans]